MLFNFGEYGGLFIQMIHVFFIAWGLHVLWCGNCHAQWVMYSGRLLESCTICQSWSWVVTCQQCFLLCYLWHCLELSKSRPTESWDALQVRSWHDIQIVEAKFASIHAFTCEVAWPSTCGQCYLVHTDTSVLFFPGGTFSLQFEDSNLCVCEWECLPHGMPV